MKHAVLLGRVAVIAACTLGHFAHAGPGSGSDWDGGDYRYSPLEAQLRVSEESPQALRTLGLMKLYGERLYGSEVARDCTLALRSLQRAADLGDPVATFMLSKDTGACRGKNVAAATGS